MITSIFSPSSWWICVCATLALLTACATDNKAPSQDAKRPAEAVAAPQPELPAPTKIILVLDGDTAQTYEILGEVTAVLADQRVYNYEGSKDQAREYLKRTAFAKYGEKLDAIINYRGVTVIGGGGLWGAIGAAYGAKNTSVESSGIAVRFKKAGK